MLQTLQKYQILVECLGWESLNRNNAKYRVSAIIFILSVFSFLILAFGTLILNIADLTASVNAFVNILGFAMILAQFLHMLINRKRFSLVENHLRNVVNESEFIFVENV